MISIVPCGKVDVEDVIRRSPVAGFAGAGSALRHFMALSSLYWVGLKDAKVACVFGLIPPTIMADTAYLWLIHTDLVEAHKFLFVRWSQIVLEWLLESYPTITGHVVQGNQSTHRWLKWLGAEFGFPEKGAIPFTIRKQ